MRFLRALSPCPLVILSLAASVALPGCWGKAPPETVFIGHLAQRSGAGQEAGINAAHGVLLAVEEANAAEAKVVGRPVAVIHPEAAGDADAVKGVAERLVKIDHVAAFLSNLGPAPTERLGDAAQQYNLPLLAATDLPGPQLKGYGFSVSLTPAEQGRFLARFAGKELKARDAALLVDSRESISAPLADAFAEEFRKAGGAEPTRASFAKDEELAASAKQAAEAGAVLIAGNAAAFQKAASLLHKEGLAPQVPLFFGGDETTPFSALEIAGVPNPVYRATAFVADDRTPRGQEFVKKYTERFSKAPDVNAALAYDAASILFETMRRAQSLVGSKVREELLQEKTYDRLTGPLVFDRNHGCRRPVFIVRLEKRAEKTAKRYEPEAP